jgi:hypothetical protein
MEAEMRQVYTLDQIRKDLAEKEDGDYDDPKRWGM